MELLKELVEQERKNQDFPTIYIEAGAPFALGLHSSKGNVLIYQIFGLEAGKAYVMGSLLNDKDNSEIRIEGKGITVPYADGEEKTIIYAMQKALARM